jgi:anti-anti-sigma regulatory factor
MDNDISEQEQNHKNDSISFEEFFTARATSGEQTLRSDLPVIYEGFAQRVVIAKFCGTISVANADIFSPALQSALLSKAEQVVLSFKDVTKVSHTAVGILVSFAAAVIGRGKRLYLYQPALFIEQRLIELKVARFFRILHTDNELINILPID